MKLDNYLNQDVTLKLKNKSTLSGKLQKLFESNVIDDIKTKANFDRNRDKDNFVIICNDYIYVFGKKDAHISHKKVITLDKFALLWRFENNLHEKN